MTPIQFNEVEGSVVLRTKSGYYKVHNLFELDGTIYAEKAKQYVCLKANGRTSSPTLFWTKLETQKPSYPWMDKMTITLSVKAAE